MKNTILSNNFLLLYHRSLIFSKPLRMRLQTYQPTNHTHTRISTPSPSCTRGREDPRAWRNVNLQMRRVITRLHRARRVPSHRHCCTCTHTHTHTHHTAVIRILDYYCPVCVQPYEADAKDEDCNIWSRIDSTHVSARIERREVKKKVEGLSSRMQWQKSWDARDPEKKKLF